MTWWVVIDCARFGDFALELTGQGRKPRVDAVVAAEFLDTLDHAEKVDLIERLSCNDKLRVEDFAEARGFPRWVERFIAVDVCADPAPDCHAVQPGGTFKEALRRV